MHQLDIQYISQSDQVPEAGLIQQWVDVALADLPYSAEILVRIVDEAESAALNEQYRHKTGPTNILSFSSELPDDIPLHILGDLVICAPVLEREALTQQKILQHHWAHIVIHGLLHLLGYDHLDDAEAAAMEAKEIQILQQLNIDNPYHEVDEK